MSIANSQPVPTKRRYRSPLRESQAAATRDRILDGLVRTMAKGVSHLSVPAIAREAGVSTATVYRHFPNKESMLTELPTYFARQSGMAQRWELPRSWSEYEAMVRHLFSAYARFSDVARAAMVSQLGRQARRAQLPARVEFSRASMANVAPGLGPEALERLTHLSLLLVSSSAYQMYESLGMTPEQAADHTLWAISKTIAAEERER